MVALMMGVSGTEMPAMMRVRVPRATIFEGDREEGLRWIKVGELGGSCFEDLSVARVGHYVDLYGILFILISTYHYHLPWTVELDSLQADRMKSQNGSARV